MTDKATTKAQAVPAPAADSESRADKVKRVLDSYRHGLQHNAPRNDAELKDLQELLGH